MRLAKELDPRSIVDRKRVLPERLHALQYATFDVFRVCVVVALRFFLGRKQKQSMETRWIIFEFEIPMIFQFVFDSVRIYDA